METPVFTSPVLRVYETTPNGQLYDIFTCVDDVHITDMKLFVNGTSDNLPKGPVKLRIVHPAYWCPEVEVTLETGKLISLAELTPGFPRCYYAGGDEVKLEITQTFQEKGDVQFTIFGFGFPL